MSSKRQHQAASESRDPPLVTVQFTQGATPSWGPGATDEMARNQEADWVGLERLFPGVRLRPLLPADASLIKDIVARAQRLTPQYRPAPFLSMFRVLLPPKAAWAPGAPRDLRRGLAAELRAIMRRHLPVDHVTVETMLAPPPVTDGSTIGTASLRAASGRSQPHLDAPSMGMNVGPVWIKPGGMGQSELLADVEQGWHVAHYDFKTLPELAIEAASGLPPATAACLDMLPGGRHEGAWVSHGTKVLGVAVGRLNDDYGVGVAPLVPRVILSSEWRVDSGVRETEPAIWDAIVELVQAPPGPVLLLEVQTLAENVTGLTIPDDVKVPCEALKTNFDVIRLAVANHIVVIEAAGNGGDTNADGYVLNLDEDDVLKHGDSGAILVGQSKWDGADHVKVSAGCEGSRIDCFAWGENVYAAAANGIAPPFSDADTTNFNGTSSASAMIAGAALVVQGLVRNDPSGGLGYLPPMQMRELLRNRDFNTPLKGGETEVIGVMPDLQKIGQHVGLLPDLYIRDNLHDIGQPHDGMLSRSPDIIVRTTLLGVTPDAAFGAGGSFPDVEDLSETPVTGLPAEVFVRVRNRGGHGVKEAKVTVWYADGATLIQPLQWERIGETLIDVPQHGLVVAGPIAWNNVPAPGHYCFIATVEHPEDKLFTPVTFRLEGGNVPEEFRGLGYFKSYIRTENNVAWRNFHVIGLPASGAGWLAAHVAGAQEGDDENMEIQVEGRLPAGASLEVELPEALAERMSLPVGAFKPDATEKVRRSKVWAGGVTSLGLARLPAGARHLVRLHVKLPTGSTKSGEVSLVQRFKGQVVGRVTWSLKPTVTA